MTTNLGWVDSLSGVSFISMVHQDYLNLLTWCVVGNRTRESCREVAIKTTTDPY